MANNNEAFELSDEQLEMVSGGSDTPLVSTNIAVTNQIGVFAAPTNNIAVNLGGDLKAAQGGAAFKDLGFLSNMKF